VYNDGNGNTSQTQTVIVEDTIAPAANVTSSTVTGQCSATVTAPTATDTVLDKITTFTSTLTMLKELITLRGPIMTETAILRHANTNG
jgi:hypothetical protein